MMTTLPRNTGGSWLLTVVAVSLLGLLFAFSLLGTAQAHDVTISAPTTFAALDGGPLDHDGSVNGVFTVNDGNLTIAGAGTITCNDSGVPNASACPIKINVSGNMKMQAGSKILAENNVGGGNGGNIEITVGGDLTLCGPHATATSNCPVSASAGALISSRKNAGAGDTGHGGDIKITVADASGDILMETGSQVLANAFGPGGKIEMTAGHFIDIDGVVSSRGLTTIGRGGPITIDASCNLTITDNGVVSSRGQDPGADRVHLEGGCVVKIFGLVESTGPGHGPIPGANLCHAPQRPDKPLNSTACVEVWAGDSLTIVSIAPDNGQVNADTGFSGGTSGIGWIDLFARGDITIIGDSLGPFAVHANQTLTNGHGGRITVKSTEGEVAAAGRAIQANDTNAGGRGGNVAEGGGVTVEAKLDADLRAGGTLEAKGSTGGGNPNGGDISIRSFSGNIDSDGASRIDVTGGFPSPEGSITLTACGTIGFPPGSAVPVTPVKNPGDCGGAPLLPLEVIPGDGKSYVILPACVCQFVCEPSTTNKIKQSCGDPPVFPCTVKFNNAGELKSLCIQP